MNQRESSGVPLRAIVMVLLFLGVVFLLVAFQAMRSDDDSAATESLATNLTTTTPTTTEPPAEAVRAEVRVYNIGDVAGAAEATAERLRAAEWDVTETGNRVLEGVGVTTVYFSDAPGEQESAEEVGQLLEAPVEVRHPGLAEEPPGVIVAVIG